MAVSAHQIALTREQQSCVDYAGSDLLVRGEPGSGKSLVLLRQAMKKVMEDQSARVLIFTFNKTLAKFARELLAQAEAETGISFARIQVLHFHGWAWGTLRDVGHRPNVIKREDQKELVDQVIEKFQKANPRSKLFKRDREFWMDEFAWLKGKQIGSLVDYAMADRKGRGAALRVQDRQQVWEAFSAYQAALAARNQMDWHDFAPELLKQAAKIPAARRADWVMVDEAQDLQVAQVRLLKEIAAKGITIAADEGQRIYKAHFTWREVGIKIDSGNSKRLTTSFRSTKQIVALAASLRAKDPEANAEGAVEFKLPKEEDVLPQLWATSSDLKEEEVILTLIQELQEEDPGAPIGLLARTWRPLYRIRHLLSEHGIPYEIVEGEKGSITTPGVKLTTFHSAKGLEFDYVILCRLNDDVTPGKLVDGVEEESEAAEILAVERRLLYVSMTRAKQRLYMTHGANPSRLLAEMDDDLYVYYEAE
jgi:superfamily I DNA/RNA helicase